MTENFRFGKLSKKHKKIFLLHKLLLFLSILIMTIIAVSITNPEIVETSDKMSFTLGAMIGFSIMILAFFNRLKTLFKIKFVVFLVIWLLLMSLQMIMSTMLWTIGLVLIPLMIDDLIILPIWNNLWYNVYEW